MKPVKLLGWGPSRASSAALTGQHPSKHSTLNRAAQRRAYLRPSSPSFATPSFLIHGNNPYAGTPIANVSRK